MIDKLDWKHLDFVQIFKLTDVDVGALRDIEEYSVDKKQECLNI